MVDRGVTIQKLSVKRGKLDQEGDDGWKEKEVVERNRGEERQEKSVVNEGEVIELKSESQVLISFSSLMCSILKFYL